jgi:hypothetical protein
MRSSSLGERTSSPNRDDGREALIWSAAARLQPSRRPKRRDPLDLDCGGANRAAGLPTSTEAGKRLRGRELIGRLFDRFAVVVGAHFNQLAHFIEAGAESDSELVQSKLHVRDNFPRGRANLSAPLGFTQGKRRRDESNFLVIIA